MDSAKGSIDGEGEGVDSEVDSVVGEEVKGSGDGEGEAELEPEGEGEDVGAGVVGEELGLDDGWRLKWSKGGASMSNCTINAYRDREKI